MDKGENATDDDSGSLRLVGVVEEVVREDEGKDVFKALNGSLALHLDKGYVIIPI